jgi:hypothetical protein
MTDSPPATNARPRLATRLALWAPVAMWAGVIFWFSTRPASQIPGRFAEEGHLGEYAILGTLLYFALRADLPSWRALGIAIAIASLYGVSDEFHQHFVATRTPDVMDWIADTVGASVGALVALGLERLRGARNGPTDGRADSPQ